MGRWSHLDSDDERLPPGMTRVGYDADTQVYTYRDTDGSYWEGAPGCRYGKLHRVRDPAPPLPSAIVEDSGDNEKPYVLHDYDDDDDDDTYPSDGKEYFTDDDDDDDRTLTEQPITPTTPVRAKLANLPPAGCPTSPTRVQTRTDSRRRLGKPLPSLPTDADKWSSTTVHVDDVDDGRPLPQRKPTTTTTTSSSSTGGSGLKRSGTLSRIARMLSVTSSSSTAATTTAASSSSSSSSAAAAAAQALSRRATVAGAPRGYTPSSSSAGRPGSGAGAGGGGGRRGSERGGGAAPRRRATTFDEILGVQEKR